MSIVVFQHSDIGGPGRLGVTLRDHGFKLDIRRPDQPESAKNRGVPSDLDNVHGVVILGGPMNVTDIDKLPWMKQEVEFIKAAHAARLPVVGICLGGQLIAHALGGQVAPRETPMVGFYPVKLNTVGQIETIMAGIAWDHPQFFSCGQEVKQTPPGAQVLAGSDKCKVQAFRAGLRTFGFLYHFECDRPMIDALAGASKREMEFCGITAGEIAVQTDQCYANYARLSDRLCVNIAAFCFPNVEKLSA